MNFMSDNAYGAAPEMLEALHAANEGCAPAYGDDAWTAKLRSEMSRVFEREVWVYPVLTGTAANALALAAIVPAYGAIFCHQDAHIASDECGAPEFFSGGARLVTLDSAEGKVLPKQVENALAKFEKGCVHRSQPAAISITQASELGTCYRPEAICALAALAARHDMKLHMDGARLGNAIAWLGCTPAEVTWRAGVDVLSFGATKNGALGAEAVVFFHEKAAAEFGYRRKQAGHLVSKMRFVSAQLVCAIEQGRWLGWAARANALAQRLAVRLAAVKDVEIAFPVESNTVFAFLPESLIVRLRDQGARFYEWEAADRERKLVRFVTSSATPEKDVEQLIAAAGG